jgi:hypothetical protein
VDVIHTFSDEIFTNSLSTLFMYHYDSLLSFPCNSTRYVSLSDLKGILLSIFLQLPTISAINLYVANASLLSFEYQLFDRIYMLVRTVFDISQHNFNGYVNLCSFIRKVAAHTFVFFHRSYVSDVCRRAILSVPSERSAEVLAMLPKKHREIFVSLSPSKAKRYRDMLIRTGVLHIPDFYDKKFTFFCNSKLNARDPKILHVNTIRFKHLVHNNNSHVLYTFFLYYSIFLYSSGTSFLHIISRSRLFNTSSFLCRNNMAFNSTRSNMFDSFTRSIVHFDCPSDRIKKKADPYAIVNKRYIVVKPFFHGDAIVFFFSPISKKTQVVYTFARLISTSITVSPVLFRLRS